MSGGSGRSEGKEAGEARAWAESQAARSPGGGGLGADAQVKRRVGKDTPHGNRECTRHSDNDITQ